MKRWNEGIGETVERKDVDDFLEAINEVCIRHDFSISHEDGHGAFIVDTYRESNIEWLLHASISERLNVSLEDKNEWTKVQSDS